MQMLDGSEMSVWRWLVTFPFILIAEMLRERKEHARSQERTVFMGMG